jgi:type II secretory pathway pseudopilin PulG
MKSARSNGYTIIEVLVVIGISSFMFVVVAISFGGRQQQIQFTQGVRDFDSKLSDIINDVSTGYYPDFDTPCNIQGGTGPNRRPNPGSGILYEIGENPDCVLIGKTIQFTPIVNNGINDDSELYNVFNVVGLRTNSSGANPTTLTESKPTIVPLPPGQVSSQLSGGIRVTRIISANPVSNTSGGIAVYTSLNRGGEIVSSSTNERLQLGVVPGSTMATDASGYETVFNNQNINTFNSTSLSQTIICVSDSENRRKAYIALGGGGSGGQISSTIEFEEIAICP